MRGCSPSAASVRKRSLASDPPVTVGAKVDTAFLPRPDGHRLAYRHLPGRGPTIIFLSGFNSDMTGAKATALMRWSGACGRRFICFDYFGHGVSSGDFAAGTITRWRNDALAVIDELVQGPIVLVGSSMGGWIATLAALVRPDRIVGLVLVAPAADMTEKLIEPSLPAEARAALASDGVWTRPSPYGKGYAISRELIEDGRSCSILPGPVACTAPLRILQGRNDADVPWRHALALAEAWSSQDVVYTLVKDGDHRLSRLQDITRMLAAVEELSA